MKIPLVVLTSVISAALSPFASATQADETVITIRAKTPGPTPFINKLTLSVADPTVLDRIQFAIAPKTGSVTRPLSATYKESYLAGRDYVDLQAGEIIVPVFGLYDDYANTVTLTYFFADGSSKQDSTTIQTQLYSDPCGYKNMTKLQPRTANIDLSYDFILTTSNCAQNSPTVVDTDGTIRWVGTAGIRNYTETFYDNGIYIADSGVSRMELDGAVTRLVDLETLQAVGLHHSIDPGKRGLILDINTESWVESVNIEIDAAGNILKKWFLGDIIRQAMIDGGDDPTPFVRNAKGRYDFNAFEDWCHNNATAYWRADDSLIISSRENFVICLDYETGAIKWILGDKTKQWYQYPSLRKYALELTPGSYPPIGQHTVSVTKDNHLLLFDNGQESRNHAPYGVHRPYSAPRKYRLDLEAKTASEVWSYPNDRTVRAAFRSSVYEDAPLNYLVHYDLGFQRVLGLTAAGEKVFDYRFPGAGFRSLPVHWENLTFPSADVRLANISARAQVKTADDVTITGFIVAGAGSKSVAVRGRGPSLKDQGHPVPGRLMNPRLELYDSSNQILQSNDNYKEGPDAAQLTQRGLAPYDDREAAILADLAPGAYTAVLRGANDSTGIGLAEIFDLTPAKPARLANLSARAFTSTGDNVLIGGLIIRGSREKRILFRGIGPELEGQGVANALANPTLELYGADGVKIASNDDWRDASNATEIEATGIAPADDREAAILLPLGAGNYTFIARGAADTEGVASVESYQLD